MIIESVDLTHFMGHTSKMFEDIVFFTWNCLDLAPQNSISLLLLQFFLNPVARQILVSARTNVCSNFLELKFQFQRPIIKKSTETAKLNFETKQTDDHPTLKSLGFVAETWPQSLGGVVTQWTDGQVMKGASHRRHIGFQSVPLRRLTSFRSPQETPVLFL